MKNIKVNFCGNCAFLYSDFNPDSAGYSTIDICQLARFLHQTPDCISVHDECGRDPNSKTPEWCPLKKESFSFEFEEFSIETKLEIEKVSEEIDELEDFFDNCLCDIDYNDPIYKAKTEQLQMSYTKLNELYKNK